MYHQLSGCVHQFDAVAGLNLAAKEIGTDNAIARHFINVRSRQHALSRQSEQRNGQNSRYNCRPSISRVRRPIASSISRRRS
jgi:hypothetical protein